MSVDFNISSLKVAIGVCVTVTVIFLMALVLVTSIWICGYSSWSPRGERYIIYIHTLTINMVVFSGKMTDYFELGNC